VNVSISFNCFSSVELVQGVHINARRALTGYVSVPKFRRDSTKLSLFKECKVTAARRAQSSSRTQILHKNMLQGVHRAKGEHQEGKKNLFSRNPLDLSY
jgi:hypothetical protein